MACMATPFLTSFLASASSNIRATHEAAIVDPMVACEQPVDFEGSFGRYKIDIAVKYGK